MPKDKIRIDEEKEKKVLERIEKEIRTKGPEYVEGSRNNYTHQILYASFGIIAVALVTLFILSIQTNPVIITDYIAHNKTLSKTVIVPINLSQYLSVTDIHPQDFSEVAYLGQVIENRDGMSYLHKFLQDDYDNRINATLGYAAIKLYDDIFPKEGITNDTYLVTGTIAASYKGVSIEIHNITLKDKSTSIQYYTEKYYEQENTTGTNNILSINITQGINRMLKRK